jgi:hypothetical protein
MTMTEHARTGLWAGLFAVALFATLAALMVGAAGHGSCIGAPEPPRPQLRPIKGVVLDAGIGSGYPAGDPRGKK